MLSDAEKVQYDNLYNEEVLSKILVMGTNASKVQINLEDNMRIYVVTSPYHIIVAEESVLVLTYKSKHNQNSNK